ncbi:MAG: 50S ribosomal protein L7ae [Sulfurihydrogenibium sp.]|jgi:ribosomal protein L7Ae-like RNA K-turn-binding protein|uniref:50S ribosomal protein L7ae n=1 Tax=Sulfurihydrogenibium azorense TaxID=309806 RepID=A0A832DQZ1_9AQUI|nr:MAG: 50S ribosomal protein L7ae [Sulfurihydrogenibium sp.]PMP76887.1 MAG: 50S ribosomal protein L7ae [Sulfurihydrogenibium sp.]HEV09574.1 50S ribosomal protein L7ae [Sulfurihydrogenibium azorense]
MDERKIDSLLQLSYKARKLTFGYENIDRLKNIDFLIIASDLSENTKRHILKRFKGEIFVYKTKHSLGALFGKKEIGVIILLKDKLNLQIKDYFKNQ